MKNKVSKYSSVVRVHFKLKWIRKCESLEVKFRNFEVLDKYHNVLIKNGSLCMQAVSQKLLYDRTMHLLFLPSFPAFLIFLIPHCSFFPSNPFYLKFVPSSFPSTSVFVALNLCVLYIDNGSNILSKYLFSLRTLTYTSGITISLSY